MIDRYFATCKAALDRSQRLLWPIRSGVWFRLAFLYLLTGSMGGAHFNLPRNFNPAAKSVAVTQARESKLEELKSRIKAGPEELLIIWRENRHLVLTLAGLIGAILFLVFMMLTWLSSRLQFVLLASLKQEDVAIRHNWAGTKSLGESFFRFNFILSLIWFILFLGAAAYGYRHWAELLALVKSHKAIAVGIVFILVSVLVAIGMAGLAIWHFLPVVMITESLLVIAAFKSGIRWCVQNPGTALFLAICYFLTAVVVTITMGVVMLVAFIPLLLAGIILLFPIIFLAWISKALAIAVAATVGGMAVVVMLLLFRVPFETFTTYLRLELIGRYMRGDESINPPPAYNQ